VALKVVLGAANRRIRFVVSLVFIALLLQFLYSNIWQQLHQEVPLPAGVMTETQVASEALDSIAAERSKRIERTPRTFASFASLFVSSASAPVQ
jgi:hypothetical protein